MELANIKLDLTQKLLNTNDKSLLNHIKAVFDTQTAIESWYEDLPDEIREPVDQGLAESEKGIGITHAEMKKSIEKWLRK
jgi:hypothetical protein